MLLWHYLKLLKCFIALLALPTLRSDYVSGSGDYRSLLTIYSHFLRNLKNNAESYVPGTRSELWEGFLPLPLASTEQDEAF
jgi:hypothetical protein